MTKNKKKNITLDDLAGIMQDGFLKAEKSTDKKIDNLAGMVQRGFLGVDKRFEAVDKRFEAVDEKFKAVDKQIRESEEGIKGEINNRIDDRVIGKAYKRIDVISILYHVFEKNKSSNGELGGDGSNIGISAC